MYSFAAHRGLVRLFAERLLSIRPGEAPDNATCVFREKVRGDHQPGCCELGFLLVDKFFG